MNASAPLASFHHLFAVGDIPPSGRPIHLAADEAERAAIAERLGLADLTTLTLNGSLKRGGKGSARFEGTLQARATQTCIVTLDPVPAAVAEDLAIRLVSEDQLRDAVELEVDPDEPDIEPLSDGMIDLGELAVQYLAVSLDPYPRSADAPALAPDQGQEEEEGEAAAESPFAVLRKLKENP